MQIVLLLNSNVVRSSVMEALILDAPIAVIVKRVLRRQEPTCFARMAFMLSNATTVARETL